MNIPTDNFYLNFQFMEKEKVGKAIEFCVFVRNFLLSGVPILPWAVFQTQIMLFTVKFKFERSNVTHLYCKKICALRWMSLSKLQKNF